MPFVDSSRCKGCHICIDSCPIEGAMIVKNSSVEIVQDICNRCGACMAACPTGAIRPNSENPALRGYGGNSFNDFGSEGIWREVEFIDKRIKGVGLGRGRNATDYGRENIGRKGRGNGLGIGRSRSGSGRGKGTARGGRSGGLGRGK